MRIITLPIAHTVYIILYLPAVVRFWIVVWENKDEDSGKDVAKDFWEQFTNTIDTIVGCLD